MTADTEIDKASSDGAEASAAEAAEGQAQDQQKLEGQAEGADKAGEPAKDEAEAEGKEKAEGEGDDDAPKGAPEEYADFTVPEGVELDAEVLGEFKTLGKDLNLSQEQAQKVADLGVSLSKKWADGLAEHVKETRQGWIDEVKADKDIGGDKLPATLAAAKRALDAYGSPAFRQLLDSHGLGDNPEFIRFAFKAGQAISEDTMVAAEGENKNPPKTHAQRIFPNAN